MQNAHSCAVVTAVCTTFRQPHRNLTPSRGHPVPLCPPPLAATVFLSLHMPILGTPCEWNQAVVGVGGWLLSLLFPGLAHLVA